ncbi:hypothetical protein DY218_02965 [Streptomyces triticagri]|uniref:Uncharacterized protein n=1 Tax=Streptomyces triticagri TaxID=2293568 RepID=A0A372MBG4_9ACTN|nr:hypothetical protein [Streptomyces triticagri]RFU88256.1 hypothetical protein DY218_02965 [Streptomyces triticagri]
MTSSPRGRSGRGPNSGAPNPYRFSPDFIKRWESRLTKIIVIGVAAAAVLAGIGLAVGGTLDGEVPEDDGRWMLAWIPLIAAGVAGGLAVLGPLLAGCVLGGLAIHRHGWIPGVVLFAGILLTSYGLAMDDAYTRWGVTALVVGVLGFFLVGTLSKVPMWIGGRRLDPAAVRRKAKGPKT